MSDPPDNDTSGPSAKPDDRPNRSFDASLRLSRLLSRPLGTPPAPGEEPVALPERPVAPAPAVPKTEQTPAPEAPPSSPPSAAPLPEPEPAAPKETVPDQTQHVDEPAALPEPVESVAAEPPVEIPAPPAATEERAAPLSAAPTEQPPAEPPASPPVGRAAPPVDEPADAGAERYLGKIRRLMLVANLFMFIAVAAVLGVIGFRVFHSGDSAPPAKAPPPPAAPAEQTAETTLTLPRGAKVVQTGVAEDRLVITIEIDGKLEIRTFDVQTLKPAGRMTFTGVP